MLDDAFERRVQAWPGRAYSLADWRSENEEEVRYLTSAQAGMEAD